MSQEQASYSIAKLLHYTNSASFHVDRVIVEANATNNQKKFLNDQKRKLESVIRDVKMVIRKNEDKQSMMKELEDPTAWDAMMDLFISLELNRREEMLEFGAFLFEIQKAEHLRLSEGGQAQYDERIAPLRYNLEAFIKEEKRRLAMMENQLAMLDKYKVA